MRVAPDIQDKLAKFVLDRAVKEAAEREESGRLTASMLGMPLQWQILKMIGVPQSPKDEYTLRKFQRGRDVEDWIVATIGGLEPQKRAEYREVTGKIDCLYEFQGLNGQPYMLPVEIKSVANAKFKWVKRRNTADTGHCLQGALYGLNEKAEYFAICYVASDDYRTMTFIYETETFRPEVDNCINRVRDQLIRRAVPTFEPYSEETGWQAKPDYNNYPEWQELDSAGIERKLKAEYPKEYEILLSGETIRKKEKTA